jgi:hypothetical protein
MAARILRLARVAPNTAWSLLAKPVLQNFPRRCANLAFSRAFSLNIATSAPPLDAVDMSSTVTEMREFAVLHGISLKGLRLKADIFAAIQMHVGVFVTVDAGAHSAGLKLQEEAAVAPPSWQEEGDSQLKVLPSRLNIYAHVIPCYCVIRACFPSQVLDEIMAQNHPPPALVALRRILATTKLSDVKAFAETSAMPNW